MSNPVLYRALLGDFQPPDDLSRKVWRFMTFAKYTWLLEQQSLFFARAATLGDNWEGAKTQKTVEMREKFSPARSKRERDAIGGSELARDITFVNCWHLNEYESQGMWKLYVDGSEGVAIQSSYDALERCLRANSRWGTRIYLGCIKYIDYILENKCDDFATPFIYKRRCFEHEREVRAIIFPLTRPQSALPPEKLEAGRSVKIEINALVEAVYVSPYAQPWFQDLVSLVSKHYGLKAPVKESELRASPIF